MANRLQYSKNAIYHFDIVRNIYKSNLKSMYIPKTKPFSVMDIGCGSGEVLLNVLYPLLPRNLSELVAIDIDRSMIEYCKSLKVHSEISFEQLDIAIKEFPKKFRNRFDVLFSSYCFTYVKDLGQGLLNSRNSLKPNGELLFILMFKKNQLYTTYRELSKIDRWQPLTKEYAEFVPHFSNDEPNVQLEQEFKNAGLTVINQQFIPDLHYESTAKQFVEVYKSLDTIHPRIPKDKRLLYMEDFNRIFSEETGINVMDETKLEEVIQMNFPTVIVHAKREDVKRK